jgi:HK97 family phage major capsid protein
MREKDKGGFSGLGEFARAVLLNRTRGVPNPHLKTLTEGTDSAGGFAVPEAWADEIWFASMERAVVRSRARVMPMKTDTLNIPILADSDRSSAIFGAITATWLAEAADKSERSVATDAAIGNLKLIAKKLVASAIVSNELQADALDFGEFIRTAYGGAVAFYEDDAYINGSGVGRPLGILNAAATISVTRAAIGAIDIPDIKNMAARLLPAAWATAIWLFSPSALAELFELTASANNSATVINLADARILGRPIVVSEHCAALGTIGDIILADFDGGYVIGDREMSIDASPHVPGYFEYDKTAWRVVLRVDGQPVLPAPITPRSGGSTVSHFVVLTTSS